MSREAIDRAWRVAGLKPAEKLLLLALADHHNSQTGLCNPGQARLAALLGVSPDYVRKHLIPALVRSGHVLVLEHGNGAANSTRYLLFPMAEGGTIHPPSEDAQVVPTAAKGGSVFPPSNGSKVGINGTEGGSIVRQKVGINPLKGGSPLPPNQESVQEPRGTRARATAADGDGRTAATTGHQRPPSFSGSEGKLTESQRISLERRKRELERDREQLRENLGTLPFEQRKFARKGIAALGESIREIERRIDAALGLTPVSLLVDDGIKPPTRGREVVDRNRGTWNEGEAHKYAVFDAQVGNEPTTATGAAPAKPAPETRDDPEAVKRALDTVFGQWRKENQP